MLQLIRTAIDTDLSSVFIPDMLSYRESFPNSGIVLIVPDSHSHTAERLMAKTFGGTGLNGVETMTFHQMTRRFLPASDLRLTDTGKRMLFFRAVKSVDITDGIFASSFKKQGFADTVCKLISEFKRYDVTPDTLRFAASQTENQTLASKLTVISDIYEKYNLLFAEENFFDSDDDLIKISQILESNEYFKNKAVWFAGFDDFFPTQLSVIDAVLSHSEKTVVFLPCSFDESSENNIFRHSEKTASGLIGMCQKKGIMFQYESILSHRTKNSELEFLIENYETSKSCSESIPEHIHLSESADIYEEIDNIATAICDYTLEYGFRYSDIAVAVSDPDAYFPFAEAIFEEYNIPYFCDTPVSISEHPGAMIISSVSDMIRENRSTASVLRFLRTGLVTKTGLTDDDIDEIENMALKRGIRGDMWNTEKFWSSDETGIFDAIIGEYANKHLTSAPAVEKTFPLWDKLSAVTEPLKKLCNTVRKKNTAKYFSNALFEFFDETGLYASIRQKAESLITENPNEALRFEQIWNLLTELCIQASIVLSNEKITFDELYYYIKNGLEASTMDIIPAGIDRVTLASCTDTLSADTKILFILGANSGKLPSYSGSEGILSDSDREFINNTGVTLAPHGLSKNLYEEFKIFKLISAPAMHLHISYALRDTSADAMRPGLIISDIKRIFPNLEISKPSDEERLILSSPEVTLKKLLLFKDRENPLRQKVYSWFLQHGEKWPEKLSLIDKVDNFTDYSPSLEPENAIELYKNYIKYSTSRLETFYVCPFRYFLENGIKAKEREERRIKKSDLGDLLHWAIQEYCRIVDDGGTPAQKHENWLSLTEEKSRKIIDRIIKEAREKAKANDNNGKILSTLGKAHSLLLRAIPTVNLSFKNSMFTPYDYEWSFDNLTLNHNGHEVSLRGIIDRLDIYENPVSGKAYIRIIDYKSGSKTFSLPSIYNKLDLQLGIYAIAAEYAYKNGDIPHSGELTPQVSGIFYDKLTDDFSKSDIKTASSAEKPKNEPLDGIAFIESEEVKGKETFPIESLSYIDSDFCISHKTNYIKLSANKAQPTLNKRLSSVGSFQNVETLKRWIEKAVVNADKQIRSGVIEIMPYKKSSNDTGCSKYCPYKDVCTFDREKNECYRITSGSQSDIFGKMNEELNEEV